MSEQQCRSGCKAMIAKWVALKLAAVAMGDGRCGKKGGLELEAAESSSRPRSNCKGSSPCSGSPRATVLCLSVMELVCRTVSTRTCVRESWASLVRKSLAQACPRSSFDLSIIGSFLKML